MTCERCMGTGRIIGEARTDLRGNVELFNVGCTDCRGTGWIDRSDT